MAMPSATNSFVTASPMSGTADAGVIGECRESPQPHSINKPQLYQCQNQGLRQRRDSDDAVEGKPSELSEEEWQHRINKRTRAIADLKATEPYLRLSQGPNRPTTPDPTDRTLNKRRWDTTVGLWKQALRATDAGAQPVDGVAAPARAQPVSVARGATTAPDALRATSAACHTTARSAPAPRAGALGHNTSSARPRVEARWTTRRSSEDCHNETRKPIKKPLLGNVARTILFVVVACAGLTCDQLLFGDVVSPEAIACEIPQAHRVEGIFQFEEFAGGSLEDGSVQASTPVPELLGIHEPDSNLASLVVN